MNLLLSTSLPEHLSNPENSRSVTLVPMLRLNEWMQAHDNQAPTSPHDNALTLGNQTEETLFDWLVNNPVYGELFNYYMGGYALGRPGWVDSAVYPVRENLIDGFIADRNAVMLVDVGGGVGHDLELFLRAYPDVPGRLVLQDQPSVIDGIPADGLDPRIERAADNFFTEQPVRGAKAYFLHLVLHDWPDDKCIEIVGWIKDAMTPGYSRLVVHEHVIPAIGASWEATLTDIYMMGLFGAGERTEANWRALLEGLCGLKVRGI